MTPDKIFHILSGIGIAAVLFYWLAIIVWHGSRPEYRVSSTRDPGPTSDEFGSLILRLLGGALLLVLLGGIVQFSEYPPMNFIGILLYTTVRFFSESRKNSSPVQEVPKPV
jgi:hypothetical protein